MREVNVLRAASFRTFGPRLFDPLMISGLIDDLKARYNFKQAPTADEAAQKPASFESGEFKLGSSTVPIEQLLISYIGMATTSIAASTRTSTDDADLFLDDLVIWVGKKYRLDAKERFPRAYNSALEFVFEGPPLDTRFRSLAAIGKVVTHYVRNYDLRGCPTYEPEGFSLHFEVKPELIPSPVPFSLQRRLGYPYAENRFFSNAPLKTNDHQAVLEMLEKNL